MGDVAERSVKDWAGDVPAFAFAWGLPLLAIVIGCFIGAQTRTAIWVVALIWMGTACLINARRCGRTHCRYTGPFYLVLTAPVILHGFGLLPLGPYGWWILGAIILFGGKIIWWATEAAWGKFSAQR